MRWKSLDEWCQADFYTGFICKVTAAVMEQGSTHFKLKTILVALPPFSYFYHHIRDSGALPIYQFSHHFHHLPRERFCGVCNGITRVRMHNVRSSSLLPAASVEMVLTVSVSNARMSKFSHLLRLADHFWWCFVPDGGGGYYQSETTRPWVAKCICNYVFVISSSSFSSSPWFFSFLLLFPEAYHSLGPLLGEKHWVSVRPDVFMSQSGYMWSSLLMYYTSSSHSCYGDIWMDLWMIEVWLLGVFCLDFSIIRLCIMDMKQVEDELTN